MIFVTFVLALTPWVWYSYKEMKPAAAKTTQLRSGKDQSFTVGRLALDFGDTTWRIAVPVTLFAGLGIFADKSYQTAPWLTLLGMVVGFIAAGILIKKQLSNVGRGNKQ